MRTRSCGTSTRCTISRHGDEVGLRSLEAELLQHLLVEALLVEAGAGSRRSSARRGSRSRTPNSTLQNSAILRLMSSESGRSVRQIRMSGWIPICISSRTECCVGLVLSSPAAAMYGTQREVDEQRVVAADVLAELADRLEERQRLDVADRAADFDDHHVVSPAPGAGWRALISSVMCGITCTVEPRYSPRRSLVMTFR